MARTNSIETQARTLLREISKERAEVSFTLRVILQAHDEGNMHELDDAFWADVKALQEKTAS